MIQLLAQAQETPIGGSTGIQGVGAFQPEAGTFADAPTQFTNLISTAVGSITIVAGLLFLAYFLIASIQWITAGGNTQQLEGARDRITNALIGLIITIAAYAILALVGSIFGIDFLNPTRLLSIIELSNN